ncbi:hypothetical protein DB313_04750 (plasmid) [Borrelia turcica IST7]|uniref:Uncharacterized protein n=1 Tax=Borrelia turcica IST7 TaxID=1104446 RepID=A0A386PMK5_9SPIR|nr:hypothetical protein [Borrelia turcica]AYE36811.1 hypothetical protein DB313_04750 [Borrelia turcica IST7]
MKYIGILFACLIIFTFSCTLYEDIGNIDAVADLLADQQEAASTGLKDASTGLKDTSTGLSKLDKKEKKVSSLKETLENSSNVLYESSSPTKTRQEEFFKWLEENDSDYSKRKQLEESMDKVFSLIKDSASSSTEIKEIIAKGQSDAGIIKAGIKTADDIKTDEQVDALVKFVTGTGDDLDLESGSSSIKAFFGTLAEVFDDDLNDVMTDKKGQKRGHDKVFEDLKKVFSEDSDGPFDILKDALKQALKNN